MTSASPGRLHQELGAEAGDFFEDLGQLSALGEQFIAIASVWYPVIASPLGRGTVA